MMNLPTFECYTEHTSKNYGLNSLRFFDAEGRCYWFSYTTLVAFTDGEGNRYVRQNEWGPTTGKHLNAIDGGNVKARLDEAAFNVAYQQAHRELGV